MDIKNITYKVGEYEVRIYNDFLVVESETEKFSFFSTGKIEQESKETKKDE